MRIPVPPRPRPSREGPTPVGPEVEAVNGWPRPTQIGVNPGTHHDQFANTVSRFVHIKLTIFKLGGRQVDWPCAFVYKMIGHRSYVTRRAGCPVPLVFALAETPRQVGHRLISSTGL